MKIKTASIKRNMGYHLTKPEQFFMIRMPELLMTRNIRLRKIVLLFIGLSKKANILVVCHCYRDSDTIIRIISARKATTNESKQYHYFKR